MGMHSTLAFVLVLLLMICANGLQLDFYRDSCPPAEQIVKTTVNELFQNSTDVAPVLIRLAFHDCFVEGCDASILLDSVEGKFISEKESSANANSVSGYDYIDFIKDKVETACPLTVSCADIVVLAARDAIAVREGPFVRVETGRRDSVAAYATLAETSLGPVTDAVSSRLDSFRAKGFTEKDMVSLIGAHTVGKAHCRFFESRLTNFNGTGKPDPSIDTDFRRHVASVCSASALVGYDPGSASTFDNHYYKNLLSGKGLLYVDQALTASPSSRALVEAYAYNRTLFNLDFSQALLKLFNYQVLTGEEGQIRKECSKLV